MGQHLTDEEIRNWNRDGFLVKQRFADPEALDMLRTAYDEVLAERSAVGDRMLGGITRQVMEAWREHPVFDDNALLDRGRAVVQRLFDTDEEVQRVFDMLIYKPAGHPHETPWHQDLGYAGMPFAKAGTPGFQGLVQFWVPLDDVDEANGCMQFVPGFHDKPLLPHKVASGEPDDPGRLLAIDEPEKHLDLQNKVVAEIPAGGATMHGYQTPHYTGPNRTTDRPRRAYIFNLATESALQALMNTGR